jgi:hypothetical protein
MGDAAPASRARTATAGQRRGRRPQQARLTPATPPASPRAQPGATQAKCECTFDEITQAVPVEEFAAYDRDLQQDPATPAPSWLADAITACS